MGVSVVPETRQPSQLLCSYHLKHLSVFSSVRFVDLVQLFLIVIISSFGIFKWLSVTLGWQRWCPIGLAVLHGDTLHILLCDGCFSYLITAYTAKNSHRLTFHPFSRIGEENMLLLVCIAPRPSQNHYSCTTLSDTPGGQVNLFYYLTYTTVFIR